MDTNTVPNANGATGTSAAGPSLGRRSRPGAEALPRHLACLGAALLWCALVPPVQGQSPFASRAGGGEGFNPLAPRLSALEANRSKLNAVVAVDLDGVPLHEALREIAGKGGLQLSYVEGATAEEGVTLHLEGVTVLEALHEAVRGTDLQLKISHGGYLIVANRPELLLAAAPGARAQQTGWIYGTVINNDTGEPLPGVNVVIENSQMGASTDADGTYTITDVEAGTYTLRASFIGFGEETREGVEVTADETTTVDFVLQEQAVGLDEVVAIGYGEQQRRDLTGSVVSVSTEEIARAPVISTEQAMQGRLAGVQVTQASSAPGAGLMVRIRGTGSITSGSEPLYVIDGVPVTGDVEEQVPLLFGFLRDRALPPNPLASLNPQDIESISVLKDASATAIYGARGANGVVLITTKQGQLGGTRVNFSSYVGTQRIVKTWELLNAAQSAQLVNEALVAEGRQPYFENPEAVEDVTDWQDEIYDPAPVQNYQASISGGNAGTRYFLSGNFTDQRGIVRNTGFERYGLRANLSQDVSSRFRTGTNLSLTRGIHNNIRTEGGTGAGGPNNALRYLPWLPVYNEVDDHYTWLSVDIPYGETQGAINPVESVEEVADDTYIDRFLGNLYAEYDLLQHLQLRTSLGADVQHVNKEYYESDRYKLQFQQGGYARDISARRSSILSETTLRYDRVIGQRHDLDLTTGFTWQEEESHDRVVQNAGFLVDKTRYIANIGSGSQEGGPNVGSGRSEWTLLSFLGRANYVYDGRYLLTLTARADGSSKFGEGNYWGFFPSAAVAWNVSEEGFMQGQGLVSNLKLRASYGVTGNQEIGTYQALARLGAGQYVFGGSPATVYVPSSVANPDLKWETSRQLDVGVDLSLWDYRLRFSADYYRKLTDDLLLAVTLPVESGFGSSIMNAGAMRNTGFEFSLGADPLSGGTFEWETNAVLSLNRNEVTSLGTSDRFFGALGGGMVDVGYPIGVFFGYETAGIFADQAEIDAHGAQPDAQPGDIRFVDTNDDGVITADDRTVIGNPHPDFTYGWNNTFSFGDFELNAFLQGSYGVDIYVPILQNIEGMDGDDIKSNTTLRRFEGRWTPEDPYGATFPRVNYNATGGRGDNDRRIQDGTYLRLKNLTLSYNVPVNRLGVTGVRGLRVYVRGTNLITFTDYIGINPDVNSAGQSTVNLSMDINGYPLAKEYTVGVDLTF